MSISIRKHLLSLQSHLSVALWELWDETSEPAGHVFLTHGTFSNRKVCMAMAEYLVKQRRRCWVLEWRNHGASDPISSYDFLTIGKEDIATALRFILDRSHSLPLSCVTHSGGGIALSFALWDQPDLQRQISSCTFFACQAWGAKVSLKNAILLRLGQLAGAGLGFLPGKMVGSPQNEPYAFMKEWFRWNVSGEFFGPNGEEYRAYLAEVKIPIFAIAGAGDGFIAPPFGCEAFLSAFPHPANRLLVASKEHGFREDYSHARVLHSRGASEEIYPLVWEWMLSHETSNSDPAAS